MSGYKDSLYWASDDEIAAYRERQQQGSVPASESEPEPLYTSYGQPCEGERVYLDVRASKPAKIDGWEI
jgi:hypothetical protein